MPPLPGPDWIRPNYGDVQPLQIQQIDQRLFTTLGISSRQGFSPLLSPMVFAVVPLPIEGAQAQSAAVFQDAETIADAAFMWRFDEAAPGAGQFQHVSIFNPANSGRIVFIDNVTCTTSTAVPAIYQFGSRSNDLANLLGQPLNLNINSPAAICQARQEAAGAGLFDAIFGLIGVVASGFSSYPFIPPIRLEAGEGFVFGQGTANQGLRATVQLREYVG